jgi:hypothetical protein
MRAHTAIFPVAEANEALDDLLGGRLRAAVVFVS